MSDGGMPRHGRRVSPDDVIAQIQQHVAEIRGLAPTDIDSRASLIDLGMQSLDFMSLAFKLERALNIVLPPSFALPSDHTATSYAEAVVAAIGAYQ